MEVKLSSACGQGSENPRFFSGEINSKCCPVALNCSPVDHLTPGPQESLFQSRHRADSLSYTVKRGGETFARIRPRLLGEAMRDTRTRGFGVPSG